MTWAAFENFRSAPDRTASLESYQRLAEDYDASCRWIVRLREAAIDALDLSPGDIVLDIACGTGATLPVLAARVGPGGRVIGIEQSPPMAAQARARFGPSGPPPHVSVIEAAAEDVQLMCRADALLFSFAHDVQQLAPALDNLLAFARPGARVAAIGMKLVPWWCGAPVNLWSMWRARHYLSTYRGLAAPWSLLAKRVPDLRVVGCFQLGTIYLAVGHVVSRAP